MVQAANVSDQINQLIDKAIADDRTRLDKLEETAAKPKRKVQ